MVDQHEKFCIQQQNNLHNKRKKNIYIKFKENPTVHVKHKKIYVQFEILKLV